MAEDHPPQNELMASSLKASPPLGSLKPSSPLKEHGGTTPGAQPLQPRRHSNATSPDAVTVLRDRCSALQAENARLADENRKLAEELGGGGGAADDGASDDPHVEAARLKKILEARETELAKLKGLDNPDEETF